MSVLNCVPSFIASAVPEETSQSLSNIKEGIKACYESGDLQRGIGFYVRQLNRYLLIQHRLFPLI